MKVELVQSLCPAATGNYDITSAGGASAPNNDMLGALFMSAATITDDNNIGSMRWSFGATDLVNNLNISMGAQDATAGAGIRSMLSTTNCLFTQNGVGVQVAPVAAFGSSLATGIRLTTSAVTANRLHNTVLISGADAAMKVGSQYMASGSTSAAQTHGLGGTPDVIIVVGSIDVPSGTNEVDGKGFFIGFYDRATGNMSSVSYHATTGANPTDNSAYVSNASVGEIINAAGTPACHVTVTAVGATTFTLTFSGSAGNNNMLGWIALRGTAAQMFSKTAVATLPTSTGNSAIVSGMGGKPQIVIELPTRMTAVNTAVNSDAAGSFGVSVQCSTDFTTTFQGMNATTFKYNVASSVAKHQISLASGLSELLNTGAVDAVATLNSWDSGGATLNYSAAAAGAFLAPMLAFGLPVNAGGAHGSFALMGVGT